jgi:hypothetical protein
MMRISFKLITGVIFFSFLFSCDDKNGFLEGTVTIGPICPVETDPPNPACQPTAETYKAYPIDVFSLNGKTKLTQLSPALDGSYNCELPPGNYTVVMERPSGIGGSNLPQNISITSKEKTLLIINIDTGIR